MGTDQTEDPQAAIQAGARLLRHGQWLLLLALFTGLLGLAPAVKLKPLLFYGCWAAWAIGGFEGIGRVARALQTPRLIRLASQVVVLLPLVGLLPIVGFLVQARRVLRLIAQVESDQAKLQAAESARLRAGSRGKAAATAKPSAAAAQSAPDPASAEAMAALLRGAIAQVKLVASLGAESDGQSLRMRLPASALPPGAAPPREDDEGVMRATKGAFGVVYLIDRGDSYHLVNAGQLRTSGLSLDELHRCGVRNLAAFINGKPGLKRVEHEGCHMLTMGGQFEASLVLVDALWEGPFKAETPNGCVVSVAARDICAFCDAQSASGLAGLGRLVASLADARYHLTDQLLQRQADGSWREFAQARRAELPPLEFR